MLSFASDYIAGAHPEVLRRLMETNLEPLPGYGSDPYCRSAAEKILSACACPEGQVYFLVGGTQTNQLVIDTLLHPWEGVLSAETGHVSVHEAGAIEFSGHKVLTLPQESGKLRAEDVEAFCAAFYAVQILVVDHFVARADAVALSCIQFFTGAVLGLPFLALPGFFALFGRLI